MGPSGMKNGECRRLQNEELHSLYRSPNTVKEIKSRRVGWAGHIAKMEEGRSVFKMITDTRRLGDNIRMDLKEIRGIGLIRFRIEIIREPL